MLECKESEIDWRWLLLNVNWNSRLTRFYLITTKDIFLSFISDICWHCQQQKFGGNFSYQRKQNEKKKMIRLSNNSILKVRAFECVIVSLWGTVTMSPFWRPVLISNDNGTRNLHKFLMKFCICAFALFSVLSLVDFPLLSINVRQRGNRKTQSSVNADKNPRMFSCLCCSNSNNNHQL